MIVGQVEQGLHLLLGHEAEGAAREFEAVDVVPHRGEDIVEVIGPHRAIVRPADLGDARPLTSKKGGP